MKHEALSGALLVPVGDFPPDLLERLSAVTGMPTGPSKVDLRAAWSSAREQYDSTRLLAQIKASYGGTVVGATAHDLFIPVLTFVFGEAELPGRAAVFSIHRLRDEFYGLPPNRASLEARALRELLHEFGHLRGLPHCPDWSCVMSSSHSVERVDLKNDDYCTECQGKL